MNSLATVVPAWLKAQAPVEWYERYEMRMETFRFPKEKSKQQEIAAQIGRDGSHLLSLVFEEEDMPWLRNIPAVEILRRVWLQQFGVQDDCLHWRSNEEIPPAALLISSPYDPEAHLSIKRSTVWTGYKVHVTETCDDDLPHVILHVETTPATTQDIDLTENIHQSLEHKHLLPSEHLMDAGYVDGEHIVRAQSCYGVELLGPVSTDRSWQAADTQAYDLSHFRIDWENKTVTCPQGKTSSKWTDRPNHQGLHLIRVQFRQKECRVCSERSQCTRAALHPRQLHIHVREQHEAIQAARSRQGTKAFQERYAKRSGIEGTISQGVRAFGLRRSRYIGQTKTHLQHMLIATAMNVTRLLAWFMGEAPQGTRISRFAALAA